MGMAKSSVSFSMKYVIRFLILCKRERERERDQSLCVSLYGVYVSTGIVCISVAIKSTLVGQRAVME